MKKCVNVERRSNILQIEKVKKNVTPKKERALSEVYTLFTPQFSQI